MFNKYNQFNVFKIVIFLPLIFQFHIDKLYYNKLNLNIKFNTSKLIYSIVNDYIKIIPRRKLRLQMMLPNIKPYFYIKSDNLNYILPS